MKSTVIKFTVAFSLVISAIFPLFAADWTGEDGNTYTALEYLEGNGNGYVLTDILPSCTDTVKMYFKTPSSGTLALNTLFSARDSQDKNNFSALLAYNKDTRRIRVDRKTVPSTPISTPIETHAYNIDTEYSMEIYFGIGTKDGTLKVNGSSVALTAAPGNTEYKVGSSLAFFALYDNGNINSQYRGQHTLYYFELFDCDGNLKNCLLPAMDNNGKKGLYDTITKKFYPQEGEEFAGNAIAEVGLGKKWTGLGGDNKMSTAANWANNDKPEEGDDIDFTIAVPNVEIVADIVATFGKVYLRTGDLPAFTGSLTATAINDFPRMQAYATATADFTFTLAAPSGQNFTWNVSAANWWAADAWDYNTAASVWYDNNTAVFNTANATATLNANVTAESVVFSADATIVTNGTDAATLTVPTVSVAQNVSATIDAPIAGALVKTGAGTLTLKSSRSEATTLSEGTLVFSGNDTKLDWSKLTLGNDPAKPVTLRFEDGAALASANLSADLNIGTIENITSTICKSGGDWTFTKIVRIGRAVGANTTFVHEDGTMTFSNYATIGGLVGAQPAKMVVCGGTVNCTKSGSDDVVFNVGPTSDGTLVVTNDATFNVTRSSMLVGNNAGNGTLDVSDGGTVNLAYGLYFGWAANSTGAGTVNLRTGGTIVADFVKRNNVAGDLTGAFNFQGGTLKAGAAGTLIVAHEKLTVAIDANGGTIDNDGKNISIAQKMTGDGGMTFSGLGTTTISANQEYTGTTTVSEGTALSVSGGISFAGDVEFAAGSKLDIANYVGGVNPVTAKSFTFPDSGTVSLTLNGGSFIAGAYAICKASLVSAEQARLSFAPSTGDLKYSWDVSATGDLLLLVGDIHGYSWTGLAGDNKFANGGNWVSGIAPSASGPVDFSAVTSDITVDMDGVTAGTIFGAVTMGTGVITFTGEFSAASFSDTSKIAVGADSTVTLVGDLVFSGNVNEYICNTVAAGGVFCVTGVIEAEKGKTNLLLPSVATSFAGTIRANGLVNNGSGQFRLVQNAKDSHGRWEIGAAGISGTGLMGYSSDSGSLTFFATITATADFEVTTPIVNRRTLTLNPAGHVITLGTSTSDSAGAIVGSIYASTLIDGPGKVVAKYTIGTYTKTNPFTVKSGATLVLVPGANLGTSVLTVDDGGTLEVAESGTVTLGGGLTVANGAVLGFNFTDRRVAPQIAVAQGKTVTVSGAVKVKVSGDVWPIGGDYVLTACGGFDAEGVSLADGAPKWAKGIGVNEEGNIVLTVRPKPTMIIVR